MSWFIYAIAAPFVWSFTNFIDKFLVEKKIGVYTFYIFTVWFYALSGIIILLIIGKPFLPINSAIFALLSGICFLYLIPYFIALKLEDTSRIMPLFEFTPLFVLIISYLFLHETLTLLQLLSFPFIVAGAFLLGLQKLEGKILSLRKALWLMMIADILYGMLGILFRYVVKTGDFWTAFAYQGLGAGISGTILLFFPYFQQQFKKDLPNLKLNFWTIFSINEVLNILGFFFVNFATYLAPIALVSVVGGVQPLFVLTEGILLSVWFPRLIKEDISKSTLKLKIFSIIMIFVGIILINK
ncbi:MAG: Conserved hypothetical membrane protein, DUF6 family [Candidatus Gottesmanbacteria bacterium GW2011_GWC2_39_8]|uniref:Conserved hypothetical membrane protein, DUF6 family n=1 Tax=Candidatus Gottesmanbacteria bacterium GW2011_GWC2_39_8 TaxID=1618450 RepID=A0A0G0PZR9_9BACT|nr:MAG: Conserved hypothetical membrane protein, DUF6 family [Candidatus Gottesmanbacteria bacterium GW2011_GWC2_39_8]